MSGAPQTTTDSAAGQRPGFWVVPILTMVTFVAMLNAMALGPFFPVISEDLNVSVALLGQVPALSMLLAAMLGLIAGPLADHIGHRRALLGSLGIAVVSSIGIGLASGYVVLLVAALIGASARAAAQPISIVIAGTLFQGDQQRRAVSWVAAGATGAVVVGVPALATLAEFFGWRSAFFVLGILTLLLMLVVSRRIDPDVAAPESRFTLRGISDAYRPLIGHWPTGSLMLSMLLGNTGVWMMATYIGAFYSDRFGYSIQQIGWVYFVAGVMLLLGSLAVGGRLGALPLRPLIAASRVLMGVAVAGLFLLPISGIAGIGLVAIQGVTNGVAMVAVVVLLSRESPAGRATTMALNGSAMSLAVALGSSLGGLFLGVAGYWLLGIVALAMSGLSAVVVLWSAEPSADLTPAPEAEPLA
jgi:MFS transporter, DHA1 family, inner membrane transport protein